MKKTTKLLLTLAAVTLLGALLALSAFAATYSGSCGTNVKYKLDTSTGLLEITGTGAMEDYTSSSDIPWCSNRSSVKTVKISDGVTSIGNFAFYYCSSLTSVTIPDSVTSIGNFAFYYCSSLTSVTISDSVTSIGDSAFYKCSSLTSVTIPDSVTSIGDYAFMYCRSLTSVTIPDSVTSIGDSAFYKCSSLTSVTIPDSVTSISDYAFWYCSSLTSVTIPDSVTSIGISAFYNTAYYNNSSNWENNVLYIGNHLIDSKTSLSGSYSISQGTKTIASYAFEDCSSLTSVTIPDSVTSIGNYAFYECRSLKNLYITDLESWLNVKLSNYSSYPLSSAGGNLYIDGVLATDITIPDSVTSIGDWAFYDCSSLTSVTFETKNATFGSDVFYNCSKLKTIYLYRNSTADAYFSSSYTKKYLDIHTISFDLNGGIGDFDTQTKKEYETVYLNSDSPAKEGYDFKGWSGSDGKTYAAGGACSANQDLVLTAIWQEKTYTVTYDANGGSGAPSSQTKYYFTELTLSDKVPARTGYNFMGWSGSDGKTYAAGDIYSTNADITLTAIWEIKVYNITYDANGGENAPEGSTKEHFETVNLSEVIPTKHGYNFGGWRGSDGRTYSAGGACSANQDLVLTAIWQEKTYTVTYDANGGSGAPSSQTKYYFSDITVASPTKTGYNFMGWSGSDGKTYSAGDTYSTNADITLTAIWEIKVYNITYDANGGENAPEGSTKEHFETVNLSEVIPTKHGYNFGGWRGSDGRTYSAGGACSVNTDIVLTAIWNPMAVTLIYDANGGNVYPSSKTVYYEESYGTLANPTRVGYTFAGWYTEKDGGSRVSSSTYVNTIENITIFAHWSANSYSVSFDANGGTISDGSKRVVFDSEYGTLPTPVLAGFTFDGWYTAIEGGARITDTTIVKNAADHTLYAHWKGASYLLILDANGGKCTPDAKNVDFGEKYGELPVPTRAGYKFITWSKTKSESGAVNADTVHNSTSDVTLYAVWLKLGDPNGDDIIDTKDAVLLAQFLAKWAVEIDPISADCNGDGVLDTKDAVLLAQYLAKWDVTLGK